MQPTDREAGLRPTERCDALASCSEDAGFLNRPFLTPSHKAAIEATAEWMRDAGMTAHIDPVGNLIGRYEGTEPDAASLLIGSHIDTVRDGGRYDGALGVMIGVECVDRLHQAGRRLPFAVEVIAFGDEEGSRFPSSMLCSRALVSPPGADALEVTDPSGVSIRGALAGFGLDPDGTAKASRGPGSVFAYLEAHIEQGPVLEAEQLAVGVVTGIAAQLRLKAIFRGHAGHAGTSPMGLRRDAIAAACASVLAVEEICSAGEPDLRGTVGRILSKTSAYNVISGEVEVGIDLRAATRATRDVAATRIEQQLQSICRARNVDLSISVIQDLAPAPCDPALMDLLDAACEAEGQPRYRLLSGAGHDAMTVAALCPVSMLFIRCKDGVSHHPDEAVNPEDVGVALRVLSNFIDRLAAAPITSSPSR